MTSKDSRDKQKRNMKQLLSVGLLFCTAVLAGNVASANPAPASVMGDFRDGGEVVVEGLGFGEKAQAAPILFDTQDEVWTNGVMTTPYAGLVSGAIVPTGEGYPWTSGNSGAVQLRTTEGYSRYVGTFSTNKSGAWLQSPRGFPHPDTGEVKTVYLRWWWKATFDPGDNSFSPDGSGTSAKFVRVWDTVGSQAENLQLSWTQMHLTVAGPLPPTWGKWGGKLNQWNLMELYLNINKDTGAITIKTWVNGAVVHNVGPTHDYSNVKGIQPRLWGLNGSGLRDWSGQLVEFSDYYADSTLARVEIGDAAKWSDVNIREPQIPLEWTSSRIRLQLYPGLLDGFDGQYLYVVIADGSVNQEGIPIGVAVPETPDPVDVQ